MRIVKKLGQPLIVMLASAVCTIPLASAQTAPNISDVPLFLNSGVPPLNMIVLGRDHKLYYEAYNDASDLNNDGVVDSLYKPTIDYFGYFDSYKCYAHDGTRFNPTRVLTPPNKKCTAVDAEWSGDFLNYVTTSRIDALRKVLYGGLRTATGDTGSLTVLERSHIPQDAHSWGKEYSAGDGYNINEYTPLPMPAAGTRHLFANTTPLPASQTYAFTEAPLLRVLQSQTVRVWNWLSIERPVAGTQVVTGVTAGGSEIRANVTPTDYAVRVQVCNSSFIHLEKCKRYPSGNYKPVGLLQDYGEAAAGSESMYFGLLSGSYAKNTSGGVLRRNIGSMRDEINVDTNGTFKSFDGIITSMNRMRSTGFGGNFEYTQDVAPGACGWITTRAINPGDCQMWGNPVAEMMYESLRYFAGRGSPTGAFATTFGQGQEGRLPGGGLPVASWDNPLQNRPFCSKPFQTVVSDINPSYDTDDLPGSAFPGAGGDDVGGLDVANLGQDIWDVEWDGPETIFIGESGAVSDGAPTPKDATSFGNIRGLAPEEPTKKGGYYSASVAYHGRTTEIGSLNSAAADSEENVNTFAVALASPLPRIDIPVNGQIITLVPFAKSVGGSGISAGQGQFQPTNQIVDFYVDSLGATSGSFRVNFEDVEQGADHDMDAIVRYTYTVSGSTVSVTVDSDYAAGGILHHLGYIVSGSSADGTYLVVRDRDTAAGSDPDYFLDTPPGFAGTPPAPAATWDDNTALPLSNTRTFSPGGGAAATLLKDPLWYAAKWGGFKEEDPDTANDLPDIAAEWDANGDGNPDNYFLVTNALNLGAQLASAFDEILSRTGSASSASVNSGSISSDTRLYQAKFNSGDWSGQLLSFTVNADGSLDSPEEWEASEQIPAPGSRKIITVNSNGVAVPFRWATGTNPTTGLDAVRRGQLGAAPAADRQLRLNYLRGDGTREDQNVTGTSTPQFRDRPLSPRNVLGDIVSSAPLFVGKPPFLYPDIFPGGTETPYSTFVAAHDTPGERAHMVYAGANDGMLHAFDAVTGAERLGFIPGGVFPNLHLLTSTSYTHQYYVDGPPTMGDAFFGGTWHTMLVGGLNKGGKSIYALDITTPGSFSEANATSIFKWEFTDAADLGYTYSRPAIVRLQNGRWAAVFGNGYNSTNGRAVLYIVDIENKSVIRKIDTGVGTGGNGLSTPALVDLNGDSIVDLAYAGDLAGNLWKFRLTGSDPTAWDVAYTSGTTKLPLFTARDPSNNPQPITSRPEVGRGPNGTGTLVLFGTGRYLSVVDKTPTQTQTFYGIRDPNSTNPAIDRVSGRSDLTSQEIIVEQSFPFTLDDGSTISIPLRVTTDHAVNNRGWFLDLLQPPTPPGTFQGEMQVSDSILRSGRIIFTTVIPDPDPCTVGGTSWLMEMEALTGSRLTESPFDNNRDLEFDGDDFVEIELEDGTIIEVPVSGLQSEVGITPKPGILAGPEAEYKYTPGTTGNIQVTVENPGANMTGRQSWRQIR